MNEKWVPDAVAGRLGRVLAGLASMALLLAVVPVWAQTLQQPEAQYQQMCAPPAVRCLTSAR